MNELTFEESLEQILAKDPRYHREAYEFVRDALEHTKRNIIKKTRDHVTGQELLAGIRQYALDQFGPMTVTVFQEWGISRCEDFGEIVFNLIDVGQFGKTETDSRADFEGGYDFADAFRKPFLPGSKRAGRPGEPKPTGA